MPRSYTLGFSSCPNDTFIFDALVNKKIDTEGLVFEAVLEDVETLNQWAFEGKLDITKLSFPAFFRSMDKYVLLNAGSALGKGVGPILISKSQIANSKYQIPNTKYQNPNSIPQVRDQITNSTIAIPGVNTTANLLLSFAYPRGYEKDPDDLFSAIEDAVLEGKADLGVIIHENRFTYQQKGLHKVMDLGEYWEEQLHSPVPLGGIAVKRNVDNSSKLKIDSLIKKSLENAFKNYPALPEYVRKHSQSMQENVMRQHIDLYVNNYSLDLGTGGRQAIEKLFDVFLSLHKHPVDSLSSRQLFLS